MTVTDLVWIQTSFIGDVVLTTAAMELAKRHFPTAHQHVVTTPLGAKVLEGSGALTSRLVFDKKGQSALAAFSAVKRDLRAVLGGRTPVVLQTHRSFRSSFLCRFFGWPTITYQETSGGWLAGTRVSRVAVLHEAARIALLLEPLGVSRSEILAARPKLDPLPLEGASAWVSALGGARSPVIGVAPGSVWGTKRWTLEGFAELTKRLLDGGATVLLLGSQGERPLTDAVAQAAGPSDRLVNAAGETSFDDLRRIYPRLSLVITNDSSPMHYASAFNVPTLGLFGATLPEMGFGPLADKALSLGVDGLACRPCSDHGPMVCPLGHFRCMKELSAERVHAAAKKLLTATGTRSP